MKKATYIPSEQKERLKNLKAKLGRQQTIFKKQNNETEKNNKASFTGRYLNAKKMKPFMAAKFIEECMTSMVREVCQEKKVVFKNILSTKTVTQLME